MMLINNDIIMNMHGIIFSCTMCFNSLLAIFFLTLLMAMKLRLATLCTLSVAVPGVLVSIILSGAMGLTIGRLQGLMDLRTLTVREVLQGIRVVKAYAWEESMEEKIRAIRTDELGCLRSYFRLAGNFITLFATFPRLIIISGLWGYTFLYGRHNVSNIFAAMQVLTGLRASCETFAGTITRVVNMWPTVQRIEKYLKLDEAPVIPGTRAPDWVTIWPESSQSANMGNLKLVGSFSWGSETWRPAVLQNLNLEVRRGEMVAIVGAVGSGKSTLLQAALGELYPAPGKHAEAVLWRPEVCAYCSQVPHIAEGTLRDNILFGQHFDQERYAEAISAASLENDLNLLPGGDGAHIGHRGISLSGGQRARVGV